MHHITLLSSCHVEIGNCNSEELYKIMERIQPDIIFEELPPHIFNIIYSEGHTPQSLEAIAIKQYLKTYPIEHIPVDTFIINETDLFNGYERIAKKNHEYIELINKQRSLIGLEGHAVLNSSNFHDLLENMHDLEESILSEINDHTLSYQYKYNQILDDQRDHEMLRNIYYYSKQHPYNKALFICGVDHRKSIIRKISENEERENIKLNWTFYNSDYVIKGNG